MARLSPLSEEPITEYIDHHQNNNNSSSNNNSNLSKRTNNFRIWLKNQLTPLFHKKTDFKILLSVIGCPLSPVSAIPKLPRNVSSAAEYIIQQFRATTGCAKIEGTAKSMFASGTVRVVMAHEHGLAAAAITSVAGGGGASHGGGGSHHKGCFVVWQMAPCMWLVELAVSGNQIVAGSDGRVAWRRTPWLGAHSAKGEVRPLRRVLQGLDPVTIAAVFSPAQHIGEKQVGDEECFALKLDTDPSTLSNRSDSTAEIIRHVMVGYFSQRSGLLIHLEDSQLTRIQYPGAEVMYWETTISSSIEDYRPVDGVMVAHSGRSVVNLVRFGYGLQVSTRMEEIWSIDDVVFNVPGLSSECFLPPEDIQRQQ